MMVIVIMKMLVVQMMIVIMISAPCYKSIVFPMDFQALCGGDGGKLDIPIPPGGGPVGKMIMMVMR